jgi:hypothetical protein
MKFRIHGNCQVGSVADSLRLLYHTEDVQLFHVDTSPQGLVNHFSKIDSADGFIEIIHDSLLAVIKANPSVAELVPLKFLTLPSITFSAFQPDTQYIFNENGVVKNGLHGDWNSRIAITGYLRGLSPNQTVELFNLEIFQALGYLDDWKESAKFLQNSFQECGINGTHWMRRMASHGIFMHGINHPRPIAIFELVQQFASIHLPPPDHEIAGAEQYLTDHLSHIVWPVYPEIAATLGLEGTYLWREGSQHADLQTFIESSFKHWDFLNLRNTQITFIPSLDESHQAIITK